MQRADFGQMQNMGAADEGPACVVALQTKTTRKSDPCLVVGLRNRSGEGRERIWSDDMPGWEGINVRDPVAVRAIRGGRIQAGVPIPPYACVLEEVW